MNGPISIEFQNELTAILNQNAEDKKMALWDGLMDKLIELAINLFDQCISGLAPAKMGVRVANAIDDKVDRARFRKRVKRAAYDDDDKRWKEEGGDKAADAALQAFKKLGPQKCEALAVEMTTGDNWWPNDYLFMG